MQGLSLIAQPIPGTQATDAEVTAAVAETLPWRVFVNLLAPPDSSVGFGTGPAVLANCYFGAVRQSVGSAQNNEFTHNVTLAAGTWDLTWFGYANTNQGIVTLSLDGASLTSLGGSATTIDGYAGSAAAFTSTITGIVVPAGAKRAFRGIIATKHASSSGYGMNIIAASFRRSA